MIICLSLKFRIRQAVPVLQNKHLLKDFIQIRATSLVDFI